jgi:hypothetical protein
MKASVIVFCTLAVSAAHATDSAYRFSIALQTNDTAAQVFKLEMPPGHSQIVSAPADMFMELSISADVTTAPQTSIRLMRAYGNGSRLVHESVQPGPLDFVREVAYVLCGEKVRFLSPPPQELPRCK